MPAKLYHGEPNGPSLTVLAALFETGFEATLVAIDLPAGDRHKMALSREVEMSIEGEGPVLIVDDAQMADSVFIARYFDDVASGGILVPTDPYACWEVMMWCRWIIERIAPAAALLGLKANVMMRHAKLPEVAGIGSVDLKQRWGDARAGQFSDAQIADSERKIDAAVAKIEAQLVDRAWLMQVFSLADLESYAWLAGMVDIIPLAFTHAPRTRAWMERIRMRPSVAAALARATVPDPRQSWAPGPEINRWG